MQAIDCTGPRLDNGVKVRADGEGDGFAQAHRELGRGFHMHDVDAIFGFEAFGANTGDRLFVEYEPDGYKNRLNIIRRFAVVALFDRKKSVETARSSYNSLSTAFYLHICRTLSVVQPKVPRFFYCCGSGSGPWTLIEVDPETGREVGESSSFMSADIKRVWREVGLEQMRHEIRQWIVKDEPS